MGVIRSVVYPGTTRRRLAALGVFSLMAFYVQLTFAGSAAAAPLTGGFSPTILSGGFADLNGNGVRNVTDDSTAFYGDTDIIDGELDCNAWGATANDGSQGNGTIDIAGRLLPRRVRRHRGRGHDQRRRRQFPGGQWTTAYRLQRQSTEQPRHRRLRFRLVGDRRPGGLERRRDDRRRRLPFRGSRPGGHPRE